MCRRSSLLALAALGLTLLTAQPQLAFAALPQQVDLGPSAQPVPAQLLQLAGGGQGVSPSYLSQKAPGDVLLQINAGNPVQVQHVTAGLSAVGGVTYVPEAPDGGDTPTQVRVHDSNGEFTVPVAAGERYLGGAGDHAVLLATTVPTGTALTLRTNNGVSTPVATLPAGTLGDVTADATAALVAFTPDGSSVPVIDAITLATGDVTQVNQTALTTTAPLVALSPGAFAWSDASAVARVPRAGGTELRRTTTAAVTALAVNDDSTGWVAGGHLWTAVLDAATDPLDHGAVMNPALLVSASPAYVASVDFADNLWTERYATDQAAGSLGDRIGQLDAVVTDLHLDAGRLTQFDNSQTYAIPATPFLLQNGQIAVQTSAQRSVGSANGRRLEAVSGRFVAMGNAADTSVTVTTTKPSGSVAPGPDLTVPVATGVDTIELSGYRLLVHRPGSGKSQLYTMGSATPVDLPLVASVFGSRAAWLNSDGSVQTKDLVSGVTTTVRPAGTPCAGSATVKVAGDEVFWSLCGENRVHRITAGTDLVLTDGDMTDARLGTGALAVLDPTTHALTVTDVDTGTSYPVATTPVAFDVDDRFVAWADNGYATHLAPLPFDNSDVGPQVLAEWGDSSVVPADYTTNHVLTFWHHEADLTQPVTQDLEIPSLGYTNSGVQNNGTPWLPGSVSLSYDGQDYRSSDEPPAKPGAYPWTISATPASGPATVLSGTLAVRDPRPGRPVVTSAPKTLVQGARSAINLKVLLGSAGLPGATVNVQARAHGTTAWKTVKTTVTSSTGTLSFPIAPSVSSDYQFVYVGTAYGPVSTTSSVVVVSVAQRVTAKLSATTVRTGSLVTLSGGVAPAKPGQLVQLQKYSAGAWHTIANVKLSSTSAYKVSLKAVRGSVSYRVSRVADRSNLAGVSPTVVLKGT